MKEFIKANISIFILILFLVFYFTFKSIQKRRHRIIYRINREMEKLIGEKEKNLGIDEKKARELRIKRLLKNDLPSEIRQELIKELQKLQ